MNTAAITQEGLQCMALNNPANQAFLVSTAQRIEAGVETDSILEPCGLSDHS